MKEPRQGDEFVWDYAHPAGWWDEMTETIADVLGLQPGGWLVEFGQPINRLSVPAEMRAAYPDLVKPKMGRTVIEWRDGRWVRSAATAPSSGTEAEP